MPMMKLRRCVAPPSWKWLLCAAWLLAGSAPVSCWDSDELEVFDVVEEVNQNFYTLLDVPHNADHGLIKKAFRRLSLVLHPDKNDAPDAEIKFRQLVSVYDVLKDKSKRRCYDEVLEKGLPDWKQAVYYYRRVRRMGLAEMSLILFVIITIGQYLVGWATYLEYKFNVEDYLNAKNKRLSRKQKKGAGGVATGVELPPEWDLANYRPSVRNTLPFQLPRLLWFLLVEAPAISYKLLISWWRNRPKWTPTAQQPEASEEETQGEEAGVVSGGRPGRRRKGAGQVVPEWNGDIYESAAVNHTSATPTPDVEGPRVISGGLWTDDDLADLVRLAKKYPVGTAERWERIGDHMGRPAAEVAHMAHKVKDEMVKTLSKSKVRPAEDGSEEEGVTDGEESGREEEVYVVPEIPKKVKRRGQEASAGQGAWSQVQQKALESALAKYPKSGVNDRWDKIAKCVPGKSKKECMLRYKQLVELVKKGKDHEGTVPEEEANRKVVEEICKVTAES